MPRLHCNSFLQCLAGQSIMILPNGSYHMHVDSGCSVILMKLILSNKVHV